jgi:hypothetical protein
MEKIEKLVEKLDEQIKSIADSVVHNDNDTLLEVSEELDTIISEIVKELKKD